MDQKHLTAMLKTPVLPDKTPIRTATLDQPPTHPRRGSSPELDQEMAGNHQEDQMAHTAEMDSWKDHLREQDRMTMMMIAARAAAAGQAISRTKIIHQIKMEGY